MEALSWGSTYRNLPTVVKEHPHKSPHTRARKAGFQEDFRLQVYESIGSSGRTRTYNPSVNSRTACSRIALQTQDLDAKKPDFSVKLGGLWGYSGSD